MEGYRLLLAVESEKLTIQEREELQELKERMKLSGWKVTYVDSQLVCQGKIAQVPKQERLVALVDSEEWLQLMDTWEIPAAGYEHGGRQLSARYILQGLEEVDGAYFIKVYRRYHKLPLVIAETSRCILRELCLEDMEALYQLYEKPGMTDYMEPLYPWDEELVYEKTYIEQVYGFYEFGMWVVLDKKTNQLIGRAGIEYRESCREREVEMGYAIVSNLWGQGYGTEVCQAILAYVREHLPKYAVICRVHPKNTASLALLTKLGFTLTDRVPYKKEGEETTCMEQIYQWHDLQSLE